MHMTVGKRTRIWIRFAAYRALEYVDIAAQAEPASAFNAFLRLKIHLLQQDSKAASDQIKAMLSCNDFSHEILRVSMGCVKNLCVAVKVLLCPQPATNFRPCSLFAPTQQN